MADDFTTKSGKYFDRDDKIWRNPDGTPVVADIVSDTGRREGTLAINPDPLKGESAGFVANLEANLVDDFGTKVGIISEATGIPAERFSLFRGKLVYEDDQGQLRTALDNSLTDKLGDVATTTPEMGLGIVGGIAGAAGGPLGATALGALGAGLGSALKSIYANTKLEEPQDPLQVAGEIALDTAIDGVAGFIGGRAAKPIARIFGRSAFPDAAQFNAKAVKETLQRIQKETGIELSVAEASGLASLKAVRLFLSKYPNQASNIIAAQRESQQGQSYDAVRRLLNNLSEGVDNVALRNEGINAAQAAIDLAKAQRALAVDDLYRTAYDSAEAMDISGVIKELDEVRELTRRTPIESALVKAKKALTNKDGTPKTDLEELHLAMQSIDDLLSKDPSTKVAKQAQRQLAKIRKSLDETLREQSPNFEIAQDKYREISETLVDPLVNGVIGQLAKVNSDGAAAIISKWFASGDGSAAQIRAVRKIIESQQDGKEIWRGLLRSHLARELDHASKTAQAGAMNVEGKFFQRVFDSPEQKKAWRAALPGDVSQRFDTVMEAFDLIRKNPVNVNSQTFTNQEIKTMIGDGRLGADTLSNITGTIEDIALGQTQQEFVEKYAIQLAEAMTDPVKMARLAQMKDRQNLRSAIEIMGVVFASAATDPVTER